MDKQLSLAPDFPPASYDEWRARAEEDLKGAPFEKKLVTTTLDGLAIQPLYTAKDALAACDEFPGLFPFTRGSQPMGNRPQGWDIRMEATHPIPAEANRMALADLAKGATSITFDNDDALREGDSAKAGQGGVAIHSRAAMQAAIEKIDLRAATVAFSSGASFLPVAAMAIAEAQRQKVALADVHLDFGADPLGSLANAGRLPCSVDTAMAQMAALAKWSASKAPKCVSVRVDTSVYHDAGATPAQDLAMAMATGVAYLRAMVAGGMSAEAAARQMGFTFSVGTQFFQAIAKLRAARMLWGRVLEACEVNAPGTGMRLHSRTGRRIMTRRDPWVNMLRNTVTCFAGAIAGAESITTVSFDSALGNASELGQRVARNTNVILQEESHLSRVIDPAGGCWFVEKHTSELAEKAWAIFQQIESKGGMAAALTSGWVAHEIDKAWTPRQKNIARRRDPITGVSEFPNLKEVLPVPPAVDPAKLAAVRAEAAPQSAKLVASGGDLVENAIAWAASGANAMTILAAISSGSEGVSIARLEAKPYGAAFEALRMACDVAEAKLGRRPRVFLANMGPVAHYIARATYSRAFFEAGGLNVTSGPGAKDASDAVKAFTQSGATVAVICSSDKLYDTVVAAVAPALKAAGAREVILAGNPGANEAKYREAGVSRFIHIGCNVLETLQSILKDEKVIA